MKINGFSIIEEFTLNDKKIKACEDKEGNIYIPLSVFNGERNELFYLKIPKNIEIVEVEK